MLIDTVLLKVASRCNLACDYCYVYRGPDQGWRRQPPLMTRRTIERVVESLGHLKLAQGRGFSILLHGGEPLLLPKPDLELLLLGLRTTLGAESTLALHTNGVSLDEEHLDIFVRTRTKIGVSLDGPKEAHDAHRSGHYGRGSFARVLAALRRIQAHPLVDEIFGGILAVVDVKTDPALLYDFFKDLGIRSVDFLLRDGNHERLPPGKTSFESTEHGAWLARLWDHYLADPNPLAIEGLDNIFRSLLGAPSQREGTGISLFGIVVIETDGSLAKNDTLKTSFDRADRFAQSWSVHDDGIKRMMSSSEFWRYVHQQEPSHPDCQACPILSACGGGMVLHRWSAARGYDNPSVYCHDVRHLVSRMIKTLEKVQPCPAPPRL